MGRHIRPVRWARRLFRIVAGSSLLGGVAALLTPAQPVVVPPAAASDTGPDTGTLPAIPAVSPAEAAPVVLTTSAAAASARASLDVAEQVARDILAEREAERRAAAARAAAQDARARADIRAGTAVPAISRAAATSSASAPAPAPAAGAASRARIVAAARAYVGDDIPYLYGGKTLAGMDCSALVWFVLRDAGLSVPYRSSGALADWGTRVPASAAVPGDLAVWPGEHVGIYVGGGQMVDHGSGLGAKLRAVSYVRDDPPMYVRVPLT